LFFDGAGLDLSNANQIAEAFGLSIVKRHPSPRRRKTRN
jgi:hypothetical protein